MMEEDAATTDYCGEYVEAGGQRLCFDKNYDIFNMIKKYH